MKMQKTLIAILIIGIAVTSAGAYFYVRRGEQSVDQPFEWVSDITPGSGAGAPPGGD